MVDGEIGLCDLDFSDFLMMIWVNILSCLDLKIRYKVFIMCFKLNEVFYYLILWSWMILYLIGNMINYGWVKQFVVFVCNM